MKTLVIALVAAFMTSCYGDSFNSEILQRRRIVKKTCRYPIDLALILDSSNSISNASWSKVKKFAKALVDSLGDVSKDGSHVAVMRFSTKSEIDLYFKEFNSDKFGAQNVKVVIDNLKQMKRATFLDRALLLVNKGIFTTAAEMRENKKIKKVVVVLTDGMQTVGGGPYTPLYDASEQLRKKSIEIYTVGVGPAISLQQLVDVATSPNYVYSVPGFDTLLNEVEKIQLVTCDCYEALDIGIILDGSSSIIQEPRGYSNFEDAKDVIVNLLKQVHVGKGSKNTHAGLIMFSDIARTKVERRLTDSQDFATASKEIKNIKIRGGNTYMSHAMELAGKTFFRPGYNGNRKNVKDVAIIITDGVSTDGYSGPYKEYIKDIPVVAVGIGPELTMKDLVKVARGNKDMTVRATDFAELKKKLDKIVQLIC